MGNASDDRANVLQFWRAVEIFSPRDIPAANPRQHVYDIASDGPLPWEHGHELRRVSLPDGKTWWHTVYGGIYPAERVRDVLQREFAAGAERFDTPPSGETALFALTVTDEGRPRRGSEEFASCAWAIGRLLSPGPGTPGWLSGFEQARAECARTFSRLVTGSDGAAPGPERDVEPEAQPVGPDVLREILDAVAKRFGITAELRPAGIRVKSFQVPISRDPDADRGGEMLNSLFAADLERVGIAVGHGDCGPALKAYLRGPVETAERVDLRSRPAVVDEHVAPEYMPAGRWPTPASRPLALSQQFAASTVLRELSGSRGIFGINGPPGTGKTTMLRELVAAIVVERARRLAGFTDPRDAFSGEVSWRTNGRKSTVSKWNEQLTGFEIVVASSNNGAVENISLEIPGRDAIAAEWLSEATYYPELATAVLNSASDGTKPELEAWGLVAGRLGKKDNRQRFVNAFWFGSPDDDLPCIRTILRDYEQQTADWPGAVLSFQAALGKEAELRAERVEVERDLALIPAVRADIDRVQARLRAAEMRADQARIDLRRAEQAAADAERAAGLATQARDTHGLLRPGVLAAWLGWGGRARDWRGQDRELAAAASATRQALTAARAAAAGQAALRADALAALQSWGAQAADLTAQLDQLESDIATARERWGDAMPAPAMPAPAEQANRELRGTWGDPEWNAARTRLFLAALRLHQEFLAAEPARMRRNLAAAVDVLRGKAPDEPPAGAVAAAWQSLFFVVPVLSTTFASFAPVFAHLGRESLGWLLIDEAGQATPQAAAGAIWRARRVVAVGDPMQIEPVVTLPEAAQENLGKSYGVGAWWWPGSTSAQRLADAANVYGTYLPADRDRVWVGAPMRVHRRCADPMFAISNTIAYGGLMVSATVPPADPVDAPESAWHHVPRGESEGHWIPQEGARARWILHGLTSRYNVEPGRVFVLSPFRDVAHHIELMHKEFPGLRGGTVHTAQGQEADVVVLILGGSPLRPGARDWASDRPNLLNVAVSRARQRLYVVGDRTAWADLPYFRELAGRLPVRLPAGQGVT